MNETIFRDEVLSNIDELDSIIGESSIDVASTLLDLSNKAMMIMENCSEDDFNKYDSIWMEAEGNAAPANGNGQQQEGIITKILMAPIRLLQAIWKIITGQFNEQSVQQTEANASSVASIPGAILNGILDFFKSDDGSVDKVKVGGALVAATVLIAFRDKFKSALNKIIQAIKTMLGKVVHHFQGMKADDATADFEIVENGDKKIVRTHISITGTVNFLKAATSAIKSTADQKKLQKKDVYTTCYKGENWVVTSGTKDYEYNEFTTGLKTIQKTISSMPKNIDVEALKKQYDNDSAKYFANLCAVYLEVVKAMNEVNTEFNVMNQAIKDAAAKAGSGSSGADSSSDTSDDDLNDEEAKKLWTDVPDPNKKGKTMKAYQVGGTANSEVVFKKAIAKKRLSLNGTPVDPNNFKLSDDKTKILTKADGKEVTEFDIPKDKSPAGTKLRLVFSNNVWKVVNDASLSSTTDKRASSISGTDLLASMEKADRKSKYSKNVSTKKNNAGKICDLQGNPLDDVDITSGPNKGKYVWDATNHLYVPKVTAGPTTADESKSGITGGFSDTKRVGEGYNNALQGTGDKFIQNIKGLKDANGNNLFDPNDIDAKYKADPNNSGKVITIDQDDNGNPVDGNPVEVVELYDKNGKKHAFAWRKHSDSKGNVSYAYYGESYIDEFDIIDMPYTAYVEFYDEKTGDIVEEAFVDEANDIYYVLEGGTYLGGSTVKRIYTPKSKFTVDVNDDPISIEDDKQLEEKLASLDSAKDRTRTVKIKPTAKGLTIDYISTKVSNNKSVRIDTGHRLVITGAAAVKKSNIMRNKDNVEKTSKQGKTIRIGKLGEEQKKSLKSDRDKAVQEAYEAYINSEEYKYILEHASDVDDDENDVVVDTTTSSWYNK